MNQKRSWLHQLHISKDGYTPCTSGHSLLHTRTLNPNINDLLHVKVHSDSKSAIEIASNPVSMTELSI